MATLKLYRYNNYVNRILKMTALPTTKQETGDSLEYTFENINFNYGDHVNVEQVINLSGTPINDVPVDYAAVERDGYPDEHYFIIESTWNRQNQWILLLRRDVLRDCYDDYKDQPFFVEKGNVSGPSDDLVFNSENMLFNQVQKGTTQLTGGGKYIVGYIDKTFGDVNIPIGDSKVVTVDSRGDIPIFKYIEGDKIATQYDPLFRYYARIANASGSLTVAAYKLWNDDIAGPITGISNGSALTRPSVSIYDAVDLLTDKYREINEALEDLARKALGLVDAEVIQSYSNTIWFVKSEGSFLKLNISGASNYVSGLLTPYAEKSDFNSAISGPFLDEFSDGDVNVDGPVAFLQLEYRYRPVQISFTDVTSQYSVAYLPGPNTTGRYHTEAPYDIFYCAYSESALKVATGIASGLIGSGALYDLQLLPYEPISSGKTWTVSGTTFNWAKSCDASGNLTGGGKSYSTALDYKLGSCCETWRVVSPNHANSWDFNPAQNGGVSGWHWEMTCKPYQPYIHIFPTFGRLYGTNPVYDARGLVCTGSFSLPVSSDNWATYQINNAAYQDSFDRTIENMSITQDKENLRDKVSATVGVVQGLVTGMAGGAMVGGIAGAAIGAGAGALASAIGGSADVKINQALRNEAIDYQKDQFGFQLRNIQAQPHQLAKSSSFDCNYATYPYIIMYNATDAERNALKAKIKYNGMSLGVIEETGFETAFNRLNNDVTYIKGKLIRNGIVGDTHIANEIANELYKGVYKQ